MVSGQSDPQCSHHLGSKRRGELEKSANESAEKTQRLLSNTGRGVLSGTLARAKRMPRAGQDSQLHVALAAPGEVPNPLH